MTSKQFWTIQTLGRQIKDTTRLCDLIPNDAERAAHFNQKINAMESAKEEVERAVIIRRERLKWSIFERKLRGMA